MSTQKSNKILIIGGTGFVGSELGIKLAESGHEIHLVTRKLRPENTLPFPCHQFEYDGLEVPDEAMVGVSTIVNLAGESIAEGRWTQEKKKRIKESRLNATNAAVNAANKHGISTLIQTSATGYYGNTKNLVDESSAAGDCFLAETAREWEEAAEPLSDKVRKVIMRIGVVLGHSGGAFAEMTMPYIMGIASPLGSGKQYLSWIHIDDLTKFIVTATEDNNYTGIYNLCAPESITYKEFHNALNKHFGVLPLPSVPSWALKIALGEKSKLLLDSQQISPARLMAEKSFKYTYPKIDVCLNNLLDDNFKSCATMDTKQWINLPSKKVWDFFSDEKNLEKITPEFLNFKVDSITTDKVTAGSIIDYSLKLHGIPLRWRSEITDYEEGKHFVDQQLKGPYAVWHHTHKFKPLAGGTLIEDHVKYRPPLGSLGALVSMMFIRKDLTKIFNYRRSRVSDIFESKPKETNND